MIAWMLNDFVEREHITHSFMTTQVGYQFATSIENHSLLYLSTGGEKLASLTPPEGYKFYNGYGPTECTIFTTTYLTDRKLKEIPIGKPLDNMRLYIVDAQGHRLPVGAAGELWISGPQVSRGYLNRPEKTAEVYISNPFTDEKKYARIYRSGDIVRYLGPNDFAMAKLCHDVLRVGYEGHGHQVHAILGFNQNDDHKLKGNFYADGAQPYKSMQTLWYHYDVPRYAGHRHHGQTQAGLQQ